MYRIHNRLGKQLDVMSALIYKEFSDRLGNSALGILEIFIEPFCIVIILLAVKSLLGRASTQIDFILFVISGIIPFYAFKDIAIDSLKTMKQNESVLIYKPVRPVDIVLSKSIVECGIYSIVFVIISLGVMASNEIWMINDLPLLLFVYFLLFITALGVAFVTLVIGHLYPWSAQIVRFLNRPLLFMSGIFFSLSQLPQNFRPFLSWNPILQSIEISRHAISNSYVLDDLISLTYLIFVSSLTLSFGGAVYILSQKRLMRQ